VLGSERFGVGYDFRDSALVCNVSKAGREQSSGIQYPADCGRVGEDISSTWNNGNFSDFNALERGQRALKIESTG